MSVVREWSAVICLAAIAAALMQNLVPGGSMERIARFVVGAFVLCAMVVPISKLAPQLGSIPDRSQSAQPNARLESAVNNQYREAAQKSIFNLVAAELGRMGIKCKNVRVMMDTNQNGSISITKVIVVLDKEYDAKRQQAAEALKKTLGLQTEVVSDGG